MNQFPCFGRPLVQRGPWLITIALVLLGALLPASVRAEHWAPPQTVFVPQAGHTVDGLFLNLWREERALIGDPITEEFRTETGLGGSPDEEQIVQYFENAALVYLPDQLPGEQVRPLDLGRAALERALAERPTLSLIKATRRTACGSDASESCRSFQLTGHTIGADFRTFWEEAGEERLLGAPLTEAHRATDGTWIQYFERAVLQDRARSGVRPLPIGLTEATRLGLDTERVLRTADIPLYATALFVAPPEPEPVIEEPVVEPVVEPVLEPVGVSSAGDVGPGPQQGGYKEIVVSISAQSLWAYEDGELVQSTLVSTGTAEVPETTTPIGQWTILTKYDIQDMEGTISDEYYFVEDVPDVMYFDNLGNALHGTYWHNNFGTPMSHGCVNLPLDVAAWMYDWAPIGTPVTVVA